MKNLNLSYVLFGVFVLTVITVLISNRETEKDTSMPIIPMKVEEKVEEVKEVITETIQTKVEEIETRIQEVLPSLDIPALKEEKVEEAPVEPVEVPVEAPTETPADSIEVETDGQ